MTQSRLSLDLVPAEKHPKPVQLPGRSLQDASATSCLRASFSTNIIAFCEKGPVFEQSGEKEGSSGHKFPTLNNATTLPSRGTAGWPRYAESTSPYLGISMFRSRSSKSLQPRLRASQSSAEFWCRMNNRPENYRITDVGIDFSRTVFYGASQKFQFPPFVALR